MPEQFLTDDFLLDTSASRELYYDFAKEAPIVDYHNHLSAAEIAQDRSHDTITDLWLTHDHYKWRAMRANGVDERFVTGSSSAFDKFEQWAHTVPFTIRSPLFHWTHLELSRVFGIRALLKPASANNIYETANERLSTPDFGTRRLVQRSGARFLCTTDDPTDDLHWHRELQADSAYPVTVLPTLRPDRALGAHDPSSLNAWVQALEQATNRDISTFEDLLEALTSRHDHFHDIGCRLADQGLERFPGAEPSDKASAKVFEQIRSGERPDSASAEVYVSTLCFHLARLNHEKAWVQQFHVGPIRNVNTRLARLIGADAGCDSIGDWNHAISMASFFDRLDRDGMLAKTILYNSNPRDSAVFATMAGNFNDGEQPGKIQYGPAWWFLDQMDGIIDHLNTLSNFGLLSRFVGMVTDSRSLLSLYSRHEYFRRVLCRVLGREIEDGLLPNDVDWIGGVVKAICSANALSYLGFDE